MSGEALFKRMGESDMKIWSVLDVGANDGESTLQVSESSQCTLVNLMFRNHLVRSSYDICSTLAAVLAATRRTLACTTVCSVFVLVLTGVRRETERTDRDPLL